MKSLLSVTVCESKLNVKNFEPRSHNPPEHLKPTAVSPGEQCSLHKESHIGKIPPLRELTVCLPPLLSPRGRRQSLLWEAGNGDSGSGFAKIHVCP